MKLVKLITFTAIIVLHFGTLNLHAQEISSVMITTVTTGKDIVLQVVDEQNNTTTENLKLSKEKPEQAFLKIEVDKWLKKGYILSQAYGYAIAYYRYETVILIRKE